MLLDRMANAQCFDLCSVVIVRVCFCAAWFRDELHAAFMSRVDRTEVLIDMMAALNLSCL